MATRTEILLHRIVVENQEALKRIEAYTRKVEGAGPKVNAANKGMVQSFRGLKASIAGLGIGLAIAGIDRLATRTQDVANVSRAFETLTSRIGANADVMLTKMRTASDGMVSDLALMKQANQAIILGLPISADRMENLTRKAIALGKALGQTAEGSIESFVTGVGRQSRLMLDNIGIMVKAEEAYASYARKLGKTTDELTDLERKTAFAEAAFEAMDAAAADLAPTIGTLSDEWVKLRVAIVNATDAGLEWINQAPAMYKAARDAARLRSLRELGIGDDRLALEQLGMGEGAMADYARQRANYLWNLDAPPSALTGMEKLQRANLEENVRLAKKHLEDVTAKGVELREILADPAKAKEFFKAEREALRQAKEIAEHLRELVDPISVAPEDYKLPRSTFQPGEPMLGTPVGPDAEQNTAYEDYLALVGQDRAEREALIPLLADAEAGYMTMAQAQGAVHDLQVKLAEDGLVWSEALQAQAQDLFDTVGAMEEYVAVATAVRDVVELMAGAFAQQGAAMLTAAIMGEKADVSLRNMMKTLSTMAFAQAIYSLAMGVAASTGAFGGAVFGNAAGWFKAAAVFASAGAAFGVIGAVSGGGASGGGGAGVPLPETPEAEPPGRVTEVRIYVEGAGYVQDIDAFARDIAGAMEAQLGRAGRVITNV